MKDQPFTTLFGEIVFNIARYLLNVSGSETPININRLYILFALAKHSRELGAFKLARYSYDKLQQIRLPTTSWIDKLDLETLSVRAKAFSDKEDLLPVCYRCGATNPLVSVKGNQCTNCKHEFVYSFHSFDVLPLVEFLPEEGISDEEAKKLIEREPLIGQVKQKSGNVQTLNLDATETFENDLFGSVLDQYEVINLIGIFLSVQ